MLFHLVLYPLLATVPFELVILLWNSLFLPFFGISSIVFYLYKKLREIPLRWLKIEYLIGFYA